MARWAIAAGALVSGALLAAEALGDPPPLRVDYQAAPGCPGEEVFLDEIRWRTALARAAGPGEEALLVRARIARRGEVFEGRLTLGEGGAPRRARVDRSIRGGVCDEVVSALALVTALALDPRASTAAKRPAAVVSPAPPAPPSLPSGPAAPPPEIVALPPPEIVGPPLPVVPAPEVPPASSPPPGWLLGARVATTFAVTPRPLFGGGAFVERGFGGRWGGALRLAVDVGATGAFDAGPGRVSFLEGTARVEGCAFSWAPARRLSITPCLAVEGGLLHGQGIPGGALTTLEQATVPWAAASFLPRIGVTLGSVTIELQGGPVFPLVRRTFVFHDPAYVIHEVPPVTGTVGLGAGVHFP